MVPPVLSSWQPDPGQSGPGQRSYQTLNVSGQVGDGDGGRTVAGRRNLAAPCSCSCISKYHILHFALNGFNETL